MKKIVGVAVALLFAVAVLVMAGSTYAETRELSAFIPHEPLPSRSKSPIEAGWYDVVRCVDGDTLIVGDDADKKKQYRIRMIGIDTPETVKPNTPVEPFGQEASEFTKEIIAKAGNRVRIAFDGEELDRYARTRAMVYLKMPDGAEVLLNELLIREGLAHARLDFRYSHGAKLIFAMAEVEARKNKRNLWSNTGERTEYVSPYEDIWEAAGKGTVQDVEYFLKKGMDVNEDRGFGGTPLYYAALYSSNVETLNYLIEKCTDVDYRKLLSVAAAYNPSIEVLKYLINKDGDVNAKNYYGETLLHLAAAFNTVEILKYLISLGADVNAINVEGKSPLCYTSPYGVTNPNYRFGRHNENSLAYLKEKEIILREAMEASKSDAEPTK